jgi:hypothetical protein
MAYRPHPKRGRTILMPMGALIFAAEIAAGFVIDHAPLKIRFPQLAKVLDSVRQLEPSKKILFLGSSRFGNAVSAEAVTQVLHEANVADGNTVFNAQIGASDPVVMEFETDKLLAAGVQPSMVVIEILPEVLSRRNLWLNFHLGRQFRWPEVWNSLPDAYLAGTLSLAIATRFNAIYTFRSEFQQWAIDALKLPLEFSNPGDENARRQAKREQPADPEVLLKGAKFARKNVRGYQIGGLNARALIRMIERYSKLGTAIVFIAPPVSSPYRAAYGSPVEAVYLAYMQRLGKSYGTYFFDYRHRLADNQFRTPYYTNTDGKLHFSRLLAREVIVPLIAAEKEGKRSRSLPPSDIPSNSSIEIRTPPDGGTRRGG